MRWFFLKDKKNDDRGMRLPASSPRRTVTMLNGLAVFFIFLGLMIGVYVFFGVATGSKLTIPDVMESDPGDQKVRVASQEILPFDVYAPIFFNRDILKTDENRLLEQTAGPQDSSMLLGWGADSQLVGVMVDGAPRAVVKVRNPPSIQFLSIGDHLGEAILTKIEENGVWFRYQNQQVQLKFEARIK